MSAPPPSPTDQAPIDQVAVDRRAVRAVATQFFVNGAVAGSIFARYPELRDRVSLSLDGWGLMLTIVGAVGLIGSAITSPLLNRFGTRRTLIAGAFVQVALVTAVGVSATPWALVIALGGISTVDVVVDVAMNLQGSWLSARRKVPIMNRLHGLWSVGTLIGGFIAARLAAAGVGLTTHMLMVSVVLSLVVWFVSRGLLATDERPASETDDGPNTSKAPVRVAWTTLGLFALSAASAFAMEQVPNDWSALRISTDFGGAPALAGMAFVAFTAGMTVGRFAGDFLAARLGQNGLFYLSVATASAGMLAAGLVPTAWASIAGFSLAGAGVAPFFPTIYDDAAQFPGRTGAALAALTAGSRTAMLTLPLLVGALASTGMTVGDAIVVVTLPAVTLLAISRFALQRRR